MDHDIDGRTAVSHATKLEYDEKQNRSLLDVYIESGRKHQIRRHLSEAGYPVVGDRLYGKAASETKAPENGVTVESALALENLQLTARYLRFRYLSPSTQESPWGARVENEKVYELDSDDIVSLSSHV